MKSSKKKKKADSVSTTPNGVIYDKIHMDNEIHFRVKKYLDQSPEEIEDAKGWLRDKYNPASISIIVIKDYIKSQSAD